MTKRFRKIKNHETVDFIRELERELIREQEGDIFTLSSLERAREEEFADMEEPVSGSFEA